MVELRISIPIGDMVKVDLRRSFSQKQGVKGPMKIISLWKFSALSVEAVIGQNPDLRKNDEGGPKMILV